MNQTKNMRAQLIQVIVHWAEQKNVHVDELVFRIRSAPLKPELEDWDPVANSERKPVHAFVRDGKIVTK